MKKTFLLALVALTFQAQAQSVQDFIGQYDLIDSQRDGDTFCFTGITIKKENSSLALYRNDFPYEVMFKAEVNGSSRAVSGSHGEAMSSYKGSQTVVHESNKLTFSYRGIVSLFGVPSYREGDDYTFTISEDGERLKAMRKSFEGVTYGIGSSSMAECLYERN